MARVTGLNQHVRELDTYLEVVQSVAASTDSQDMALLTRDITTRVVRALEADAGWTYLLDTDTLEPGNNGEVELKDEHGLIVSLGKRVINSATPITEHDRELILNNELSHVTLVGFPLRTSETSGASLFGAIVLAARTAGQSGAWESQLLLQLGRHVASTLGAVRLRQEGLTRCAKASVAIEATSDGVMIIDREQRIENVNPAFESLTGFSKSELLGKPCRHVLQSRLASGEYLCDVLCSFTNPAPRGPNTIEATIQNKDGDTRWVAVTSTPIDDSGGRLIGEVYTFRDITERKETDKLKDDFISLVSHEFRSPVTVIMGMSSTLLRKEMPLLPIARSGLKDILAQAKRLNRLVDNLLMITRSRAGNLEVTPEHVRVDKIGAKVIKEIQGQGQCRGCTFAIDFPRDFPPAFADPLKLELVLRNLLENAVKFSPNGGTIRFWGRQEDSLVVIGVEDQGLGISGGYLESIFQAFFRLEDPRVQAKPGIGLGLAACQSVVEAHGGKLWAESEPGKGSLFAFTLPAPRKIDQA